MVNFNISASAQVETTFDNTESTEAVTSVNDAVLKSLVIISQVAVLGIIFNYFIFGRFLNKKRGGNNILLESMQQDARTLKRVTFIVVLCSISIVFFSTCMILLQSYQLSENLDLDIYSAFDILYTTSVGQVWMLRVGTSSAIIVMMIISYAISGTRKKRDNQVSEENPDKNALNKIDYFSNNRLSQMILLAVIVLSSTNLFSNSMVSHSNSLSSFSTIAVSMDWIHFMAVSMWIGGLFFLSLIFLKNIMLVDYDGKPNSINTIPNVSNNIMSIHDISISLMNFSFIVIIALCVIGISGLYLSYVHLQNLNSLIDTVYGKILILKLGLAFPLIFIGRYNQIKIYQYTSLVSNLLKDIDKNTRDDYIVHQYRETRTTSFIVLRKSLKLESILALSVLIVASFLSVTSPPSLEATDEDSSLNQNIHMSKSNNSLFFYLVITLALIISIFGIINFRKNQKRIESIFDLMRDN